MHWVASSLEQFGRATSRVATIVIVASIVLSPTLFLFSRLQLIRASLLLAYFVLAITLKVILRCSDVGSLFAVRLIEGVSIVAFALATLWVFYSSWSSGFEGPIVFILDGSVLIIAGAIVRKNISEAKSMASQAQS